MANTDQDDIRRLHDILRQRHAELRDAEPGTSEYDRLRALALGATDDLVAREEAVRGQDRRRLLVMVASGLAGIAVVAAVVLMIIGQLSWWFLALVVPVAVVVAIALRPGLGHGEEAA